MEGQQFPEPSIDPEEYKAGFLLVWAAFVLPILFLSIDLSRGSTDWFAPSGAAALFLAAFVQQKQLSRLQMKHFRNSERALKGQQIRGLSTTYQKLERRVFALGLYSTAIWAYGDKVVKMLLKIAA